MDFYKVSGVNFKDHRREELAPLHVTAKIVILDHTRKEGELPALYLATGDAEDWSFPIQENSFTFLGNAVQVDKSTKTILLEGQKTVSYEYLVVISGRSYGHERLHNLKQALETLMASMRLRDQPKIAVTNRDRHPFAAMASHFSVNPKERGSLSEISNVVTSSLSHDTSTETLSLMARNGVRFELCF